MDDVAAAELTAGRLPRDLLPDLQQVSWDPRYVRAAERDLDETRALYRQG